MKEQITNRLMKLLTKVEGEIMMIDVDGPSLVPDSDVGLLGMRKEQLQKEATQLRKEIFWLNKGE